MDMLIEKLKLNALTDYPFWQFSLLKWGMSLYLILHFAYIFFENPFTPIIQDRWLLAVGIAGALAIVPERTRRFACILVWLCLNFFFRQNIFLFGINHDFIGWLLLALVCLEAPFNGKFPTFILKGAWLILGAGYLISGVSKIVHTDFWTSGVAAEWSFLIFNRISVEDPQLPKFLSFFVLGLEVLFPFAYLNRLSRFSAYCGMSLVHLALLSLTYCTEIAASVLLWHLLIYDQRWHTRSYWRLR
jgi:hypothetical protein